MQCQGGSLLWNPSSRRLLPEVFGPRMVCSVFFLFSDAVPILRQMNIIDVPAGAATMVVV
jgi:hypothetical protein